ncbi:hypothetical protein NQ317_002855 [Molorchus minor]|uniref:pyridoxal 5'-phosphate synthase n=1 Tax=Molorchus minor TaxID=1323400 RepID=A0ABQ9JVL9_9CUCU|nr:hypothetical protein NQ317_002855 [Molorchus minor]
MIKNCLLLKRIAINFMSKQFITTMNKYQSGLAYIDVEENGNPFDLFKQWLEESKKYGKINNKENPKVSACFLWSYIKEEKNINRQVRIEGTVEQLSDKECAGYYNGQPLFAQIRSNIIRNQSAKVDWIDLKKKHDELLEKVKTTNEPLQMPEHEVAYKIIPTMFDFYYAWNQNIADRILFTRNGNDWALDRIAA